VLLEMAVVSIRMGMALSACDESICSDLIALLALQKSSATALAVSRPAGSKRAASNG